jgi:hypothetical protein
MKTLKSVNENLFNYIINVDNYLINLDRTNPNSYRHPIFFKNPLHKLYSVYNPISNIDIYVPGMSYYNGYLDMENPVKDLHGVYQFDEPANETFLNDPSEIASQLNIQIDNISENNQDNFNIIFIFVCRLIEFRIPEMLSIMPKLNSAIYFPNISINQYFSNDKETKIFQLINNTITKIFKHEPGSELFDPRDPDIQFSIRKIPLQINKKLSSEVPWIQRAITLLLSYFYNSVGQPIHDINDINKYIYIIFNNEELFNLLKQSTYGDFKLKQTISSLIQSGRKIKSMDNLILFLCQYYVNPLFKVYDDIIKINRDIEATQIEIIGAKITERGIQPSFFQINLHDNLYSVLNLESINYNRETIKIRFFIIDNDDIYKLIYKYFESFKLYPNDYKLMKTTITDKRISFNFWCFYNIIRLLNKNNKMSPAIFNYLFNIFFTEDITLEQFVKINPTTKNIISTLDIYRNILNDTIDISFFNWLLRLFENSVIIDPSEYVEYVPANPEPDAKRVKQKYLKYKMKYLTLKNSLIK